MPPAARERLEEAGGEKFRQRLAGKYPAVQKLSDFFSCRIRTWKRRDMPSPPGQKKRNNFPDRNTILLSLGLRKIRDFPENSEEISGGEKSPKQCEPRSIHPTLAWKRTFGRRFIHLSLSVRGAPLSLVLLCLLPVHYKIHTQHTKNAGRSPGHPRAGQTSSIPSSHFLSFGLQQQPRRSS